MIASGRFEVDAHDARACRYLVQQAWVPRSRRETLMLRLASSITALAPASAARLLGPRDEKLDDATLPESALATLRSRLDVPLAPRLSLRRRASDGGGHLLFLWRPEEELPFAIAKIVAAPQAGAALDREAEALRAVAALPPQIASLAPRLLLREDVDGMALLAMTSLPGQPLLRRQRMSPSAPDGAVLLGDLGEWLGSFDATTISGDACRVHGDLWSRNVLVTKDARIAGIVDFEASRMGDPIDDVAHFLVTWLASEGMNATPAARAFASRWSTALGRRIASPDRSTRLSEAITARLRDRRPADDASAAGLLAIAQELR